MNFICGKSTRLAIALSIAIGTWQSANAVGLGPISVDSHIGEPLRAYINVNGVSSSEASNASITLASNDAYQVRGIKKLASHDKLRFSLSPSPSGAGYVINVSSTQRIREPFINFLLDMKVGGQDIIREYAVFLEPGVGGLSTVPLPPVAPIDSAPVSSPVTADAPKPVTPMPSMTVEPSAPPAATPVLSATPAPITPLPTPPMQADIAANQPPVQQPLPIPTPEIVINNTPSPIKPLPGAEVAKQDTLPPATQPLPTTDITVDASPSVPVIPPNFQPPLPPPTEPSLPQASLPTPAQPEELLPPVSTSVTTIAESEQPPVARPRLKGPRLLAVKPASRKKGGWQGRSALPVADSQSDAQPEVINVSISPAPQPPALQPETVNEIPAADFSAPSSEHPANDTLEELPPDVVSPRVMNPAEFLDLPPSAVVGNQPQEATPLEDELPDQLSTPAQAAPQQIQPQSANSAGASVPLSGRTYGPIQPGETLFSIAEKFRPSDAYPLKSVMRDIYQANRSAFSSSDLSSLLAGVTLQIPMFDGHLPAANYPESRASNVNQAPQRPRTAQPVTRQQTQQTAPAARAPRTQVRQEQPIAEESQSEPEAGSRADALQGRTVTNSVNTPRVIKAQDETVAVVNAPAADSASSTGSNDDSDRVALLNAAPPANGAVNSDAPVAGNVTSDENTRAAHDAVQAVSQDNLTASADVRSPLFVEDANNNAVASNTVTTADDAVQSTAVPVENDDVQPANSADVSSVQAEAAQSVSEPSAVESETAQENQIQESEAVQSDEEGNIFERFFFSTYALLPNWQWLAIGLGVIVLLAFLLYRRSRSRSDVDDGALDQQEMEAVLARINALDHDEHSATDDALPAQDDESIQPYGSSETASTTSAEDLLDDVVALPGQHEDNVLPQKHDDQDGILVSDDERESFEQDGGHNITADADADDAFAQAAAMVSLDKTEAREADSQQNKWLDSNADGRHDAFTEVSVHDKQLNSETSLNDGETMSDDNNPIDDDFDFLELGGDRKKSSSKQGEQRDDAQDEGDNIDFLNSSLDEDFYEMEVEERKKTVQQSDDDEDDIIDATVSEDQSWMDELVFESNDKQPKKSPSTAQQKPVQQKSPAKVQPVSNISPEEMEINLDLAASFIATGHGERALSWLEEVLEVGTIDQKARAKEMLAQIPNK